MKVYFLYGQEKALENIVEYPYSLVNLLNLYSVNKNMYTMVFMKS